MKTTTGKAFFPLRRTPSLGRKLVGDRGAGGRGQEEGNRLDNMKRLLIGIATALATIMLLASPILAIALPSSTPSIQGIHAWRNVLENGDMLIVIEENTPISPYPTTIAYSEAFIWRWIATDNTTDLAQSVAYDWFHNGYSYNVVSFYLGFGDAPAWNQLYHFRLSGTPIAYASPPQYNYDMQLSNYSPLTDTTAVKQNIADTLITLATDLENKWALATADALVTQEETGSYLSIYGQSFFRGAIYGVQAMAPSMFPVQIYDISDNSTTFTTAYSANLTAQNTGNYIGTALTAGESFLGVSWNMMGFLMVLFLCIGLLIAHWKIAGGNLWRGMVEFAAPLVISIRMGLMDATITALIVALCWLFISAKVWRIV